MKIDKSELYRIAKNGGYRIDRRTIQGRQVVKNAAQINKQELNKSSDFVGICAELTTLSYNDLKYFFNTDRLNN